MRITLVSSAVAMTAAAVLLAPAVASATTRVGPDPGQGLEVDGHAEAAHVPVTLALASRNAAGLKQAAAKGGGLTPAQFNARYAPTAATVSARARRGRRRTA